MAYIPQYSDEASQSCNNTSYSQDTLKSYLLKVPEEYILDKFNETDLQQLFTDFQDTLEELVEAVRQDDFAEAQQETLVLYGLLHKRYIQTEEGLNELRHAVLDKKYGVCPKYGCNCILVPAAFHEEPGISPFVVYCVKCNELYQFSQVDADDGAFFGCNIAQLFFMRFPQYEREFLAIKGTKQEEITLCGFRIDYGALLRAKIARSTQSGTVGRVD